MIDSNQIDFMEEYVKEKFNLPNGWQYIGWKMLPRNSKPEDWTHIQIDGACFIGKPTSKNWANRDKSTQKTVIIGVNDVKQYKLDWEKKTGKCSKCQGTGKELYSVGVEGKKYRECKRCHGTGK